jgi:putative SOS response-associated peptidase YedK
MCGRYVQASSPALLAERFGVTEIRERLAEREPDYNVTPRREVPVVAVTAGDDPHRTLDLLRWGLVPSWAKDLSIGDRMINARAETVATKPAYRKAFEKRRCIIPADGFYEWRRIPGRRTKQPYFIHRIDREPLAFAGLWERWKPKDDPDAPWTRSCAIVTTGANATLTLVHDRMPVVLPESAWEEWLDPENHDVERLQRLLVPAPADEFALYPVSTAVNRPVENSSALLEPVPEPEVEPEVEPGAERGAG